MEEDMLPLWALVLAQREGKKTKLSKKTNTTFRDYWKKAHYAEVYRLIPTVRVRRWAGQLCSGPCYLHCADALAQHAP